LATNEVNCFIAEKSEVNDAAVRFTVVGDVPLVGVVVGVVVDDDFDELLHADAARAATATIAMVTTRCLDLLRIPVDDPLSELSTSVSCHMEGGWPSAGAYAYWLVRRCCRRIGLCVFGAAKLDGREA